MLPTIKQQAQGKFYPATNILYISLTKFLQLFYRWPLTGNFGNFQLPRLDLSERQVLFVSEAFNPGKFFGQFSTIGTEEPLSDGLQGMGGELNDAYSKLEKPPKLYQTNEQRLLGYYGDDDGGKLKKPLSVRFLLLINNCHFT